MTEVTITEAWINEDHYSKSGGGASFSQQIIETGGSGGASMAWIGDAVVGAIATYAGVNSIRAEGTLLYDFTAIYPAVDRFCDLGKAATSFNRLYAYDMYLTEARIGGLAGSGTRMVVADADGDLSTQPLTINYPATVLDVVTSDGFSGDIDSVASPADADILQVEEATGVPGFDIQFAFDNVATFNNILLYSYYHGGAGHVIEIQLRTPGTSSWVKVDEFTDDTGFHLHNIPILDGAGYVDSDGEVELRIYHTNPGNGSHYIEIDYLVLRATSDLSGGGGVTHHGNLTGLGAGHDDHPQYALLAGRGGETLVIDEINVDIINESTGNAGVTIEGVLFKDDNVWIPATTARGVYWGDGATSSTLIRYTAAGGLDIIAGGGTYNIEAALIDIPSSMNVGHDLYVGNDLTVEGTLYFNESSPTYIGIDSAGAMIFEDAIGGPYELAELAELGAGGGGNTFENGLTENSDLSVVLGGTFDETINIDSVNDANFHIRTGDGTSYGFIALGESASDDVDWGIWEGVGGNLINVSLNTSRMQITDEVNSKGFTYAADYSGNFTDRSLVDKGYVDSVAGGGGNTFENGLTENSDLSVDLGGELTSDVTFTDDGSYDFTIGSGPSNAIKDFIVWGNTFQFVGEGSLVLLIQDSFGGNSTGFQFNQGSGMNVTDSIDGEGMHYAGDYSTNGISENGDRWIPDKGYVDGRGFTDAVSNITEGDYFVATWGDDGNDGSFENPWATWHYAFNQLSAGDTLYIRGGIYYSTDANYFDESRGLKVTGSDGTSENRICVFNYPGEKPIFDGSLLSEAVSTKAMGFGTSSYWHLKGLTMRYFPQVGSGTTGGGFLGDHVSYFIFENMIAYGNGGHGFNLYGGDTVSMTGNEFLNCDSYDNYDPESTTDGGDADGFSISSLLNTTDSTILIGCRAWNNSDDGFEGFGTEGIIIFQDCWSFDNGYQADGNGMGFKLGDTVGVVSATYIRQLYNCISSGNKVHGIVENETTGLNKVVNCTSYKNGDRGINWDGADEASIYRNILSYDNVSGNYIGDHAVKTHDHNTYNIVNSLDGITATDADFISVDSTELYLPRKYDNSLPDIDFLKLDPHSKLVGAGIDVGLPFYGYAPDVGATNITTLSIIRNDPYTSTSSGTLNGTHLISAGSKAVTITSGGANNWIFLPYASAATIGTIISGTVAANGFELRTYFNQLTTVYINNVTTNVEAAIPANHSFEVKQIDATHWILRAFTNLGAEITPIVPNAI